MERKASTGKQMARRNAENNSKWSKKNLQRPPSDLCHGSHRRGESKQQDESQTWPRARIVFKRYKRLREARQDEIEGREAWRKSDEEH